jgi:hypothetical protein
LFGCDLEQINERPNENDTFLDLVFTNVPLDMAVEDAEAPLLNLDRRHKAYEIEMQICSCKIEVMEGVWCMAYGVWCMAIVDELDAVDWCSLFLGRWIDQ